MERIKKTILQRIRKLSFLFIGYIILTIFAPRFGATALYGQWTDEDEFDAGCVFCGCSGIPCCCDGVLVTVCPVCGYENCICDLLNYDDYCPYCGCSGTPCCCFDPDPIVCDCCGSEAHSHCDFCDPDPIICDCCGAEGHSSCNLCDDPPSNEPEPEPTPEEPLKSSVDLADVYCFDGYDSTHDCYAGAVSYMNCVGLDNTGSRSCVFLLGYEGTDANGSHIINSYGASRMENAINTIDEHLDGGNPIMIGVDYKDGTINEGTTDHFVVVTGRGYDTVRKQYYYTYVETARYSANADAAVSSTTNKLYYDSTNNTFGGNRSYGTDAYYTVTQIRPNNGNCTATQSY